MTRPHSQPLGTREHNAPNAARIVSPAMSSNVSATTRDFHSLKHHPKSVVRAHHRYSAKHSLTPILRKHRTRYSKPVALPRRYMLPSLGVEVSSSDTSDNGTPSHDLNGASSSVYQSGLPRSSIDKDRLAFLPMPSAPRSPSPDSVMTTISSSADSSVPTVSPIAQYSPPSAHIRFNNLVRVKRIPSRTHYPEDIKRRMWCNSKEIQANARRNAIEYAAESWDWRSATEEDHMIWNPESQKRVHPVHLRGPHRRQQRQGWQLKLRAQARKAIENRKLQLLELQERERREAEAREHIMPEAREHIMPQRHQLHINIHFSPVRHSTATRR